jgi:PDZ domain-containing protein
MSRRVVTLFVGAVLLVALGVFGAVLPVPYTAIGPGPTLDTLGKADGKDIIRVEGKATNRTAGHLNLTTVSVQNHLDLVSALRGWVDSAISVVPREELYPPDKSEDQTNQQNTADFVQSQGNAALAALAELHYPQKVVVQGVAAGSASKGRLRPGDVLLRIDGTAVPTLGSLERLLTGLPAGRTVRVGYLRERRPGTVNVALQAATRRKGGALGVLVAMNPVAPDFDVTIQIDERIGGPSAGLMFALGIMEKVGPQELTGGRFVAGTGTIDPDGKVGPIGGIPLKMIGARGQGATVFLVPTKNCPEARADTPAGLELVRVGSLHDALAALATLRSGGVPPGC